MTADAEIDVWGQLAVNLGSVAAELRADRERKQRLAASIWYVSAPVITFTAAQATGGAAFAAPSWGPNTGYAWAVQRITVAPLANADVLTIYRGVSAADAVPQNAVNEIASGYTAGDTSVTWHPGRTGFILMPDQGIVLAGTLAGTAPYAVSADVIQMELDKLPYFLL